MLVEREHKCIERYTKERDEVRPLEQDKGSPLKELLLADLILSGKNPKERFREEEEEHVH
jgi:hypothetical protein